MACWLRRHEWGWPRRRGDADTQVCVKCGASRPARIQFGAGQSQAPDSPVARGKLPGAEEGPRRPRSWRRLDTELQA